jgi:sulfoxide reductase catalytic subunit YedY
MLVKIRKPWDLPDNQVTDESAYWNRRNVLKSLGLTGTASLIGGCGLGVSGDPFGTLDDFDNPYADRFPYPRNEDFQVPERPLTDPIDATTYNNFYEFTRSKDSVHLLVGNFQIAPWQIEFAGLCNNPGVINLEDLLDQMDDITEQRIYRFRCVERWAMTVPWTGFPLAALIAMADPMAGANFVQMVSENRPEEMPNVDADANLPWPYFEGLTMEEATNPLAMMVTGIYGQALPRQNGAPLRLIVPWKYGYKSIKSVIRIVFTEDQPPTFWNSISPSEYSFLSNVDPETPHPRWSQAEEWLIPGREPIPTMKYNGYGEFVADLSE